MEEKIRLAVFGQKRLSREGGIEIVVKELCTRMAQKIRFDIENGNGVGNTPLLFFFFSG